MSRDETKTPKLVIVPTPIGNLGDITLRSIEALESADEIYAEDTRMTKKLISVMGIETKVPIHRLDENTMDAHASDVADAVEAGKLVAYCTDAGMPGVSDPGLKLVSLMRKREIPVEVLPGASASIVAYVSSTTENPHFYFGGFLPRKKSQMREELQALSGLDAALVFYESPNRLARTLQTISTVFPFRKVSVCRELTKLHEEVLTGDSKDIAEQFQMRDDEGGIKGECVIVIDGPTQAETQQNVESAEAAASKKALELASEGVDSKTAVKELVSVFGISKNRAYDIFLDCKKNNEG